MKQFVAILCLLLLSFAAFATEALAIPGESVFDVIAKALEGAAAQSVVVAMVLEFVFRLIPSKKPLGVLHVIGAIAKKCGELLVAFGVLLDKVLPQNVK